MEYWDKDAFYIPGLHTKPLCDEDPGIAIGLNKLRKDLQNLVGRPVNFQATSNLVLYARDVLFNEPYFTAIEPEKDVVNLKLLSYNIRFGGRGRESRLAEVIRAVSPDLVVFQEATDTGVIERLANDTGLSLLGCPKSALDCLHQSHQDRLSRMALSGRG